MGLAVCIHCGASIVHHQRGPDLHKYPYYVCGTLDRTHGIKSCTGKRIQALKADAAILDAVLMRIMTLDFLEELITETQLQLSNTESLSEEIKRKKNSLRDIKKAINNLLDLAESFGSGAARVRL